MYDLCRLPSRPVPPAGGPRDAHAARAQGERRRARARARLLATGAGAEGGGGGPARAAATPPPEPRLIHTNLYSESRRSTSELFIIVVLED